MSDEDAELAIQYDALQLKLDDLIAGKEQFTDLTNAELFVKAYKDRIRYCMPWKKWLIWAISNRSMPAGTGVCVVNTVEARPAASASSKGSARAQSRTVRTGRVTWR